MQVGLAATEASTDLGATPWTTWRLVTFGQDHDQIGNRAAGDRLTGALDDDQLACAALDTDCVTDMVVFEW